LFLRAYVNIYVNYKINNKSGIFVPICYYSFKEIQIINYVMSLERDSLAEIVSNSNECGVDTGRLIRNMRKGLAIAMFGVLSSCGGDPFTEGDESGGTTGSSGAETGGSESGGSESGGSESGGSESGGSESGGSESGGSESGGTGHGGTEVGGFAGLAGDSGIGGSPDGGTAGETGIGGAPDGGTGGEIGMGGSPDGGTAGEIGIGGAIGGTAGNPEGGTTGTGGLPDGGSGGATGGTAGNPEGGLSGTGGSPDGGNGGLSGTGGNPEGGTGGVQPVDCSTVTINITPVDQHIFRFARTFDSGGGAGLETQFAVTSPDDSSAILFYDTARSASNIFEGKTVLGVQVTNPLGADNTIHFEIVDGINGCDLYGVSISSSYTTPITLSQFQDFLDCYFDSTCKSSYTDISASDFNPARGAYAGTVNDNHSTVYLFWVGGNPPNL
jgi:hypothetical protein